MVRRGSAKPLFPGSNPGAASSCFEALDLAVDHFDDVDHPRIQVIGERSDYMVRAYKYARCRWVAVGWWARRAGKRVTPKALPQAHR